MNALPVLFTSARVMTSIYRIVSTALLLYYIAKRLNEGREIPRSRRRLRHIED